MQLMKGEISYQMDNLFYESFGMSCDEVFEALIKKENLLDLLESTKVTAYEQECPMCVR